MGLWLQTRALRDSTPVAESGFRGGALGADCREAGLDEAVFEKIARQAFSARRKTLRNALPLLAEDYKDLGLDPKLRPENLSPADYVRIAFRASSSRF